ncbi:hypothetical protein B7463_g11886, partial [Scytalidium lignicola]
MAIDNTFTNAEVASHFTKDDLYMVIHNTVYDLTSYLSAHPGGENILLDLAGQDATEAFEDIGHSAEARKELKELEVGKLAVSVNFRREKSTAMRSGGSAASLRKMLPKFCMSHAPIGLLSAVLFVCGGVFLWLLSS